MTEGFLNVARVPRVSPELFEEGDVIPYLDKRTIKVSDPKKSSILRLEIALKTRISIGKM